jgi:hypothetical protein
MTPEAMSRAFAATLADGGADPRCPSLCVGLEHEYRVLRDGERVDFAELIGRLELGRPWLDPADANAGRLPSGTAVTCDGPEAEIALPPVAVQPGFTRLVGAHARADSAELARRLVERAVLDGCSTHISVSIDAELPVIDAVAWHYARSFAPGLMLLLDRRDSYGVYIRPRPGRLELCGEFVAGERLRAALAFAAGSVRACAAVACGESPTMRMPPVLQTRVEPARDRFGYLVHRRSMGGDLYAEGRTATLRLESGGTTTAQAQLAAAWSAASAALEGAVDADDLSPAQQLVLGDRELPVAAEAPVDDQLPVDAVIPPSPFGRLSGAFHRPGYDLAPVMLTWDVAVLLAASLPRRRTAFVCVPRSAMGAFVSALDRGALDGHVRRYLRASRRGARLHNVLQTAEPGIYCSLGRRRGLLPAELSAQPSRAGAHA